MVRQFFLTVSMMLFAILFVACSPKPYSYPNYDIIKPKVICKPNRKNIQILLNKYLDKPYIWAEEGPDAFDCSGLTYSIYGQMGVDIPRVARDQAKMGKRVKYDNIIYGDLIFFGSQHRRSKRITHVGIYLGDGWFAHASSRDRKVTYTHFEKEPIYLKRMKLCRRYMSVDEKYLYMSCDSKIASLKTATLSETTPWRPGNKIPKKAIP